MDRRNLISLVYFYRKFVFQEFKLIIDPKNFNGFGRVFTGVIVPRPIAFVSTISNEGHVNLSPYSFFNAATYDPPTLVFSISKFLSSGKLKHTLKNIQENSEFVVNIVSNQIAEAMNVTSAEYPEDTNEFAISGLTQVDSQIVRPPRLAESPVNMECKLERIVELGSERDPHGLVIGEVVLVHIDDEVISGHHIDHQKLDPVGRLAGDMYCHTTSTFDLIRPVV